MALTYDVAVLGGGIGGYTAAIRAAQLGKKVAIIEQDMLGGTCLHRGCIPSKTFLRSAEVFATFKESEQFGIQAENISVQFDKIQQRKVGIVNQLHRGVIYLMQKNKIDVIQGKGRVIGPSIFSPKSGAVAVELQDGEMETVVPTQLIIATGSRPRTLPGIEIDGQYAMTSDEALNMTELPKSMIIVGGGVIGAEWASLLSDFGVEVTIIEMAAHLLPTEEQELGAELQRLLKKRGVRVLTQASLNPDSYRVEHGQVHMEVTNKGKTETIQADKLLISIGREANVNGIGLENTDIKVERGVIVVNESMQTTEPHIFAVGDVIGGLQLAHAAGHEGIIAAERIAGLDIEPMQAHLVPRCIYTRPEVASVGFTEKQALEQGRNIKTAKVSFKAIGKALVYGDNNGFVKVIADQDTNDILGVHMIGPHVTDQISEAVLAQILDATPWEVGQAIHPHPTLSEIMGEAMLAIDGKAIGI
ncbi:dihydrolipoyl dehydrogenase [Paenibacillus selenitireducens]|uniref:Dihydrolipoyl dehydrogenase n=1 Tax=Paenibacillus selenitireducens TaxID=1324314 RepID=A0A1T2XNG9_9BACL|nr:dihydrolipoyl dehydrogenase [Paenibacillus selenitireducens]OPA81362.1 dihydrolipoyl dehydrogenase [Paenibacillus selenitireducens]